MLLPAVLVGIGIAGTLDEALLHQILNWHHFYTDGESVEMLTDGLFHLLSTGSLVAGLVMLWRRGARPRLRRGFHRCCAGGAGGGSAAAQDSSSARSVPEPSLTLPPASSSTRVVATR